MRRFVSMATNKNALIRYRTIDLCLQNRSRRWTLEDLINACSDALYEAEGKHEMVSKRTTQLDIQVMRSSKLGYNAPIIVYDRKYYSYEDPNYSITQTPIDQMDMDILAESVQMLRQFKDFSLFSELQGVIQKLEDKIYRESGQHTAIIHLDKNDDLKGLHHIDSLYQAINKQIVLNINYQSFKARKPEELCFHPYILKEFNNRWFLVGRKQTVPKIMTLALDRIIDLSIDLTSEYISCDFDADLYYANTYGVTVLPKEYVHSIELKINKANAPYVITKPFHRSQKLIEKYRDGSILISLRLHVNFELERLILGFGESIEVIKPVNLRRRIIKKLKEALKNYG